MGINSGNISKAFTLNNFTKKMNEDLQLLGKMKSRTKINEEYLPYLDVCVVSSRYEPKTFKTLVKKNGVDDVSSGKIQDTSVFFMICSNDDIRKTRWYRDGKSDKVLPFFPTKENSKTVVDVSKKYLDHIEEEEEAKDPTYQETPFSQQQQHTGDKDGFRIPLTEEKDVTITCADWNAKPNPKGAPSFYFPTVLKVSRGRGVAADYFAQKEVRELPRGINFYMNFKKDRRSEFKQSTYFRLKGVYCEKVRGKSEKERDDTKRKIEELSGGGNSGNGSKKSKVNETDTPSTGGIIAQGTNTSLTGGTDTSTGTNTTQDDGPWYYNIVCQDYEELEIHLQGDEERSLRAPQLLINDPTTDTNARKLDMLCGEVQEKLEQPMYLNLGLTSTGYDIKKPNAEFGNLQYFFIPAENIAYKPFFVREAQPITSGTTGNTGGVGQDDPNSEASDEVNRKVDIIPSIASLVCTPNRFDSAMLIGRFTFEEKTKEGSSKGYQAKMSMEILHKELVISKNRRDIVSSLFTDPFSETNNNKKTTTTTPPQEFAFFYLHLKASCWRNDPKMINGIWDLRDLENSLKLGCPSILAMGSIQSLDNIQPVDEFKLTKESITNPASPLKQLFQAPLLPSTTGSRRSGLGSVIGQLIHANAHFSVVNGLLEKYLQENGFHFNYENHMNRLLGLLCDHEVIIFNPKDISTRAETQKLLLVTAAAAGKDSNNGRDFCPDVDKYFAKNVVNEMNLQSGSAVINHKENPKLIHWDGIRQACVRLTLETSMEDNSWKVGGAYKQLLDVVVVDGYTVNDIIIESLYYNQPRLYEQVHKSLPSWNEIKYHIHFLLYNIGIGRIMKRMENMTNSGPLQSKYYAFAKAMDEELIQEFKLDKDEGFMKKHTFPDTFTMTSAHRMLGKFGMIPFSIEARNMTDFPIILEETVECSKDTIVVDEQIQVATEKSIKSSDVAVIQVSSKDVMKDEEEEEGSDSSSSGYDGAETPERK